MQVSIVRTAMTLGLMAGIALTLPGCRPRWEDASPKLESTVGGFAVTSRADHRTITEKYENQVVQLKGGFFISDEPAADGARHAYVASTPDDFAGEKIRITLLAERTPELAPLKRNDPVVVKGIVGAYEDGFVAISPATIRFDAMKTPNGGIDCHAVAERVGAECRSKCKGDTDCAVPCVLSGMPAGCD